MVKYINVSDIATLTDMNPYRDSDECLEKYRKKFNLETSGEISKTDVVRQKVKTLMKEKNMDMSKYLDKITNTNSVDICAEILEKVVINNDSDKVQPEEQPVKQIMKISQDDVKQFVQSEVYREHGNKFELTVFEWLKKKLPGVVSSSQKGAGHKLGDKTHGIYGKVDGLYEDPDGKKFIIEIKNRQKRFFSHIPIYEQVQIQMYMMIFKIPNCMLVQQYRGEYKIAQIKQDDKFIQNTLDELILSLGRM